MDAGQQLFQLDSQDTRGKTAIASSWQQASPELYTQDGAGEADSREAAETHLGDKTLGRALDPRANGTWFK